MQLEIPENAHVVINIGGAPMRAPTGEFGTPEGGGASRRPIRLLLMLLIAGVAFGVGHMVRFSHEGTRGGVVPALAASPIPAVHPSPPDSEIPPAFREGLSQPAQVTPPPGQPSAVAPSKNPFGLEN